MKVAITYGVVADHGSKVLKLCMVKDEGLSLVSFKDGMPVGGMPLTKSEVKAMFKILCEHLEFKPTVKVAEEPQEELSDVVKTLTTLPPSDGNYIEALKKAAPEELNKAIEIMKNKTDGNKTRLVTVEKAKEKKKAGRPKKDTSTAKPKAEKPKEKMVQFPKEKPQVEKAVTEGSATYVDCLVKIKAEKEKFKDGDSQYVLDGLAELCKVDQAFRNNFMRKDKTFEGVLAYMAEQVKAGYGYLFDQVGMCDKDMGLAFAIDYYNLAEKKQKEA